MQHHITNKLKPKIDKLSNHIKKECKNTTNTVTKPGAVTKQTVVVTMMQTFKPSSSHKAMEEMEQQIKPCPIMDLKLKDLTHTVTVQSAQAATQVNHQMVIKIAADLNSRNSKDLDQDPVRNALILAYLQISVTAVAMQLITLDIHALHTQRLVTTVENKDMSRKFVSNPKDTKLNSFNPSIIPAPSWPCLQQHQQFQVP